MLLMRLDAPLGPLSPYIEARITGHIGRFCRILRSFGASVSSVNRFTSAQACSRPMALGSLASSGGSAFGRLPGRFSGRVAGCSLCHGLLEGHSVGRVKGRRTLFACARLAYWTPKNALFEPMSTAAQGVVP